MKRSNMKNQRSLWIVLLATLTLGWSLALLGCTGDVSSGSEVEQEASDVLRPLDDPMPVPPVQPPAAPGVRTAQDPLPLPASAPADALSPASDPMPRPAKK